MLHAHATKLFISVISDFGFHGTAGSLSSLNHLGGRHIVPFVHEDYRSLAFQQKILR